MFNRNSLPKVLLCLAAFVFFSANTIYILEAEGNENGDYFNQKVHFDFDNAKSKGIRLNLKSAMIINYDNGEVLYNKNGDKPRSVASLSKLVSAMVILDKGIDLSKKMKISKQDAYRSSRSRLSIGYELTLKDLLHASLLSSDNRAARALARATSGSIEAFARDMNLKMKELGLDNSLFFEPTGLDKRNVSTAHEVLKILHYSYQYEAIRKITQKKAYYVKVLNRRNKKLQMVNTNMIVHSPYKVLNGKTGYTIAADYCLTTLVKNRKGERVALAVLGVPGDKLRFKEARKLLDWAYKKL